jgi:hypothetical protein
MEQKRTDILDVSETKWKTKAKETKFGGVMRKKKEMEYQYSLRAPSQ